MSLDERVEQSLKEDVLRLVSVEATVPSDEDIADLQAQYEDYKPRASITVIWEPLSYRVEAEWGNQERDRVSVVKAVGLTPEEVIQVREHGWLGIPKDKLIKVPKGDKAKTHQEFPRWMKARKKAGLHMEVNEGTPEQLANLKLADIPVGQLYSNDIGQVFACVAGFDDFPIPGETEDDRFFWDYEDPRQSFMRYPMEKLIDYVAPAADELPVKIVESSERATAQSAVETQGTTNISALVAAAQASGLVGMKIKDLKSAAAQMKFVSENMATAPILGTTDVQAAVNKGELLDYLIGLGVIAVVDGRVVAAT